MSRATTKSQRLAVLRRRLVRNFSAVMALRTALPAESAVGLAITLADVALITIGRSKG